MDALTRDEQNMLVKIFQGNGKCNCFEVMAIEDDNQWALNTIGFNEIPVEILQKLDITNAITLKRKYTLEMLVDEDYCCGFHIYWDKTNPNSPKIKNKMAIGLYIKGSGDYPLNFSLEDIFDKEHYDILYNFGFEKIKDLLIILT